MAINSPRDIPGLRLWLSAEAITGMADDTEITGTWRDLSVNGFHGTPVGTTKPKYRTTAGQGGGPAVQFPNDGYFTFGNVMASASAGEMMMTVRHDTGDTGSWAFGADTGNNDESHYPFSGEVYESFGLATSQRQQFTPSMSITSWRRYNVWSAAGDWAARLDETSQHTHSGTVGWTSTPTIGAGRKNGSVDLKFRGWIGCVVVYNRKLTTAERADLAAWMTSNPSGGDAPSYADEVLADSPLGYWRLGDASGTTLTDSSGNARHGSYVNTPTLGATSLLATDSGNTAVTFNGTDEYASVTSAAWMNVSNITLECLVKSTASVIQQLLGRDSDGNPRIFQFRLTADGKAQIIINPGVGPAVTGATTINDGQAHHVVATYDGANVRLYVDGVQDGSTAYSGALATGTLDLNLARRPDSNSPDNYLNGTLDEAAFYGTALSAARIAAHYDAAGLGEALTHTATDGVGLVDTRTSQVGPTFPAAVQARSPWGYWRLAETAGTTAADSSGNGRNGTYSGSYTLGRPTLIPNETSNPSVDFSAGAVTLPTFTQAGGGVTLLAAVRPDTITNLGTVIGFEAATFESNALLLRVNNSRFEGVAGNANGSGTTVLGTGISTGTEYLVALVFENGFGLRLYVNGTQVATAANTSALNVNGAFRIAERGGHGDRRFDGRIDDVAVFPVALSAADIAALNVAARGNAPVRVHDDTAGSTDAATPERLIAADPQQDTLGLSDTTQRDIAVDQQATSQVNPTDAISTQLDRGVVQTDPALGGDTHTRVAEAQRQHDDSLPLTDSSSRLLLFTHDASDTTTLTDTISVAVTRRLTVTDSTSGTDSIAFFADLTLDVGDIAAVMVVDAILGSYTDPPTPPPNISDPVAEDPPPPNPLPPLADPADPPALAASSGGFLAAGTYEYCYRSWQVDPIHSTAESPSASVTVAADGKVTVTIPDVDPNVDGYSIFRRRTSAPTTDWVLAGEVRVA